MEKILTPEEINRLLRQIIEAESLQSCSSVEKASISQLLENFALSWQQSYTRFGQNPAGELAYRDCILDFKEQVLTKLRKHLSKEGEDRQAVTAIEFMLFPTGATQKPYKFLSQSWRRRIQQQSLPKHFECPEFDRPLFIVSAPRAGSTLLFESLSQFEEIWSIGKESHDIESDIPYLHPSCHNYKSNRLTNAPSEIKEEVKRWFSQQLRNRENQFYLKSKNPPSKIRFLEKTPKNALRIPFLKQIFPDAQFIFLYRTPVENISSLLEGWRSNRFLAYKNIPDWEHKEWHFLLPLGWRNFKNRPLVDIAAYQWRMANQCILDDLKSLEKSEWCFVNYQDLLENPIKTLQKISQFAKLQWNTEIEQTFSQPLPLSSMVISPPMTEKWRKYEKEIIPTLATVEYIDEKIRMLKKEEE